MDLIVGQQISRYFLRKAMCQGITIGILAAVAGGLEFLEINICVAKMGEINK